MTNHRTYLYGQLLELSRLMDILMVQITQMQFAFEDPTHYVNVFGRQDEWHHRIDIKRRAYDRLLQRFETIKQQIQ